MFNFAKLISRLSRNASFALRDTLRDAQIKDEMQYGSTKQFQFKKNLDNTF